MLVKFQTDHWLLDFHSLKDFTLVELDQKLLKETVASYVDEGGDQNWNALSLVLPEDILDLFPMMKTPIDRNGKDMADWMPNTLGQFKVKSAYKAIYRGQRSQNSSFNYIWKLQVPQRLRAFTWLVALKAMLTNYQRRRKGLTMDAACPHYPQQDKALLHVLLYSLKDVGGLGEQRSIGCFLSSSLAGLARSKHLRELSVN